VTAGEPPGAAAGDGAPASDGSDPTGPVDRPTAPLSAPSRRLEPLALVVLVVGIGVVIAALHHPRPGMFVAGAGLALGALLRLVLSPQRAGLLVVRQRRLDVVVLVGLAVALTVLAAVTPFPAGQG
jgi:Protein of unknown function (DUF3017)